MKRVLRFLSDPIIIVVIILGVVTGTFVIITQPHDTDRVIYREIRAYKHLPNGNTDIYYKGGAIEIEGTLFFNLDTSYEFYREENSTVWHVDPY